MGTNLCVGRKAVAIGIDTGTARSFLGVCGRTDNQLAVTLSTLVISRKIRPPDRRTGAMAVIGAAASECCADQFGAQACGSSGRDIAVAVTCASSGALRCASMTSSTSIEAEVRGVASCGRSRCVTLGAVVQGGAPDLGQATVKAIIVTRGGRTGIKCTTEVRVGIVSVCSCDIDAAVIMAGSRLGRTLYGTGVTIGTVNRRVSNVAGVTACSRDSIVTSGTGISCRCTPGRRGVGRAAVIVTTGC